MTNDQLGRLARGDERRDAVHIAVAPVEAWEELGPGQHVGLNVEGKAAGDAEPHIGIVDPFLHRHVQPGQRFFLMLYPNSITSLRHEWVHPAFGLQEPMDGSRLAAERVANQCGKTYEALMDDARGFQESFGYSEWGDHIMDNSERYKEVSTEDWEAFWLHFERATGTKANEKHRWAPYTCSC